MRKLVGALALLTAVLFLIPETADAEKIAHPKKYGVQFQVGGGYYAMQDLNDFVSESGFLGLTPDKINIGSQFGIGFLYRNLDNFGWTFGYNRLIAGVPVALEEKYRIAAYFSSQESWVEQTVAGSELYAMATWYWDWGTKEIFFGVGPALYSAGLDRSVSIVRTEGAAPNPAGSFSNATGRVMGLLANIGIEFPVKKGIYLALSGGGRLAQVSKLTYRDDQDVEQTVKLNSANASLPVDFTGGFAKLTVRTYFKPSTKWRSLSKD